MEVHGTSWQLGHKYRYNWGKSTMNPQVVKPSSAQCPRGLRTAGRQGTVSSAGRRTAEKETPAGSWGGAGGGGRG